MDASRVLQSVIEAEQRQKETSTVHEPKSEAGDDVEVVTRTVGSLTFRVEPAPKTATPGRSSSSRSSNHNNAQAHANQNTRTVSSEASLTSQAPIVSSLSRMPQPARKSATPTAGGGERRTQIDRDPEENMDELYVSTVALVQSGDVMNTLNFVKAHPCVCRFLVPFEMDVSPPRQQTLLQIFARAGLYHAVKFLLQLASENDHQGFVDLEARDAKFRTALHWAAINDLTFQPRGEGAATQRCYQTSAYKTAKELLKAGARVQARDSDGFTLYHFAALNGRLKIVQFLLVPAVQRKMLGHSLPTDRFLLTNREDSALHLAALQGHHEVVAVLIAKGGLQRRENFLGYTPLHCAVLGCRRAAAAREPSVEQVDQSRTASSSNASDFAQDAIINARYLATVRLLVQAPANFDVNAISLKGDTPLHLAAQYGFLSMAELLVGDRTADGFCVPSCKARVDIQNAEGHTAAQCARAKGHVIVADIIDAASPHSLRNHGNQGKVAIQ
eukprot:INCI18387.2.p1 GENE.INCI18387.2~~INCI18387.2.p1  ORF type:complete len:501 (-),score=79.34 INCI18387.2:887-2389(-)